MWGMYLCISPEKTTTNSTRLAITCFSLNRLNASSRLEHSLNSLDTSSTTASLGVTKVCSRWGGRHPGPQGGRQVGRRGGGGFFFDFPPRRFAGGREGPLRGRRIVLPPQGT